MSDAQIFRDLMNEVLKGGKRKILIFSGMARKGLTKEMACGHDGGGTLAERISYRSYRSRNLGVRGRWVARVGGIRRLGYTLCSQ